MGLKLENGRYVLNSNGLPAEVSGLEELLQNCALRLAIPKGSFPYGRELGSGLHGLDRGREHAPEQAVALANEALMDLPGVLAEQAEMKQDGGIRFTLSTPLGKGEIDYGNL